LSFNIKTNGSDSQLYISRLNNKSSDYLTDEELYNSIVLDTQYLILTPATGEQAINLGEQAVTDLKNSISSGTFSIGILTSEDGTGNAFEIYSSSAEKPELQISYV